MVRMTDGSWKPVDARHSALNGNVLIEGHGAQVLDRTEARARIRRGERLYVLHNSWCPASRAGRSDRARSGTQANARKDVRRPFARPQAPTRQGTLFR